MIDFIMAIFQTYSKQLNGLPSIYTYGHLPSKLKNQIFHIWKDFFFQEWHWNAKSIVDKALKIIHDVLCREHGKKNYLVRGISGDYFSQIEMYFDVIDKVEEQLDIIQVVFVYMLRMQDYIVSELGNITATYLFEAAVKDLNIRFKENGIGYEFVEDNIIRIDSTVLHTGTVEETLLLIANKEYSNVNEEYIRAHKHYLDGRNQECLNDCLKSFESTMKIIIHKKGWSANETDTAKTLIKILLENNFLPKYHDNQLTQIRLLLESSIPTIRNKNSGHGQGVNKVEVSNELASYMLYMTGATIRFLVQSEKSE